MNPENLDPDVWGPYYWFFLHTIAYSYPVYPNEVTKRKYYDLIHNFPLFIPHEKYSNRFIRILDRYPVTPYLDKRESFMRWVNFVHNKINEIKEKDEYSLEDSIHLYEQIYADHRPPDETYHEQLSIPVQISVVMGLCLLAYIWYREQ